MTSSKMNAATKMNVCLVMGMLLRALTACGGDATTPAANDLGGDPVDLGVDTGVACANMYYRDLDGDGQGAVASGTLIACSLPAAGYAPDATDCNDTCAACYVGATEICDGRDNDCSGVTDENLGGPCTSGVGACASAGRVLCDGTCDATPGTPEPESMFHTIAAPNGSWDWDCDGTVTGELPITEPAYTSAASFCRAQACDGDGRFFSGAIQSGLTMPGGTSPYCGQEVWTLGIAYCFDCTDQCYGPDNGTCNGVYGRAPLSVATQGCR